MAEEALRVAALDYHEHPTPGKISIAPTKVLATQRDLSLAYSPGVAYACLAIKEDPKDAALYTARANLVAVITNGSAVLGLGNIGALAGKPVMEGKGCLFKKFAGIDVFDIELGETDPDKIVGKDIREVKLVCSGAGAAAIACLDLQVRLGLNRANVFELDSKGLVHKGRTEHVDPDKARYAQDTRARTLGDVIGGADIFLGLSTGGVLTQEMVKSMAEQPIILAMANPEPEIRPELAKEVRPDCLIGTGRSDYPNQVNNSLCFPFIFRGALD